MEKVQSRALITEAAYEQLLELCIEAKPLEACGLLVSTAANSNHVASSHPSSDYPIIDMIIPITNTHIDPTHTFAFDPEEWTRSFFDMQKNQQSLVGLFHSHPRTDAVPSSRDSDGFLPASELSYWIVSLRNEETPHVQPYCRTQGAFIPIQLVIT